MATLTRAPHRYVAASLGIVLAHGGLWAAPPDTPVIASWALGILAGIAIAGGLRVLLWGLIGALGRQLQEGEQRWLGSVRRGPAGPRSAPLRTASRPGCRRGR